MNNLNFRIGMTAPEVLIEIVRVHPGIKFLYFHYYIPRKGIKERGNLSISDLLHHDPSLKGKIIKLKGEDVRRGDLGKIYLLIENEVVGVISKTSVESPGLTENQVYHIPMMDFCCEGSSDNLKKIREFLSKIGQKRGVILWSGNSYHYYGVDLLTTKEWLKFLGVCLLFTGYVDERYIGHRLLDGCGILRISSGGIKPEVPKIVSVL